MPGAHKRCWKAENCNGFIHGNFTPTNDCKFCFDCEKKVTNSCKKLWSMELKMAKMYSPLPPVFVRKETKRKFQFSCPRNIMPLNSIALRLLFSCQVSPIRNSKHRVWYYKYYDWGVNLKAFVYDFSYSIKCYGAKFRKSQPSLQGFAKRKRNKTTGVFTQQKEYFLLQYNYELNLKNTIKGCQTFLTTHLHDNWIYWGFLFSFLSSSIFDLREFKWSKIINGLNTHISSVVS